MNRNGYAAVTVLLDAELSMPSGDLDLREIQARTCAADPAVRVGFMPRLRDRLDEGIAAAAQGGADRLVLCLDSDDYSVSGLQLATRKAGLDFLGVEVINFAAYPVHDQAHLGRTEWATTVLKGVIARVRASGGSRPENLKPFMPSRMSRRSLFTLPVLEYRAMPTTDLARCRARDGCRQCVQACLRGALENVNGYVQLDKSQCTSCGRCVTACPQEAVSLPGATPNQLTAQIVALLGSMHEDDEPRGILFHCQNSERALEQQARDRELSLAPNWLPVQVPCLGMVTWNCMLAPLAIGAAAVGLLACRSGCRSGQPDTVAKQASLAQSLLLSLGDPDERIILFPSDKKELARSLCTFPLGTVTPATQVPRNLLSHDSRASILLQLAERYEADQPRLLDGPLSPFGGIDVTEACTLCGGCASACPTGALLLEETSDASSLSFDGNACIACEQCLPACPEEDALHLRHATDLASLARGRTELRRDEYQRCESCGGPIASTAMSQRVAAMLGDEFAGTVNVITRYCVDCRGLPS